MIRKALAASVLVTMLAASVTVAVEPAPVFDTKWGSNGSGEGQFAVPGAVAVDTAGNVYVTDVNNHRIQKFSSSGGFLATWGSNGSGDGQFAGSFGVAVDAAGNVYVADDNNHRVQKFSSSGGFLATWGSNGSGDGQFANPTGVVVDAAGNVYVTDHFNHRIQKFVPRYPWSGFQGPISDPPALNELKAGAAVPVKFSLGGDQGLAIFAAGYPKSVPVACNASAPVDAVDETVAAGKSGLTYDASTDEYTYVWKTDKAWAGTCRQLTLKLDDASTHWAIFKFR